MSNKFTDTFKSLLDSVKSIFKKSSGTSEGNDAAASKVVKISASAGGEALAIEGGNTFLGKLKSIFKRKPSLDSIRSLMMHIILTTNSNCSSFSLSES